MCATYLRHNSFFSEDDARRVAERVEVESRSRSRGCGRVHVDCGLCERRRAVASCELASCGSQRSRGDTGKPMRCLFGDGHRTHMACDPWRIGAWEDEREPYADTAYAGFIIRVRDASRMYRLPGEFLSFKVEVQSLTVLLFLN